MNNFEIFNATHFGPQKRRLYWPNEKRWALHYDSLDKTCPFFSLYEKYAYALLFKTN